MNAGDFTIGHAALVLPERVIEDGWLTAADGRIVAMGEGSPPERSLDFGGDYLVPGLIELHTDHLESHYAPRPGVRWHPFSSVLAYDAQIAASGITTVFDSLRVGSDADSGSLGGDLWPLADAIAAASAGGYLRAEHRTHLRCEIASPDVIDQVETYVSRYAAHLISLMDHTPGQRQFRDLATWRAFYTRKSPLSEAELDIFVGVRLDLHARFAGPHRRRLVQIAQENGIAVASHDDATAAHVDEAVGDGVALAEFPTTMEAARASHQAGISVMMGGPNVVRGGSHTGNVAAEELAREGLLDVLSSDYVPASLAMAAFELPLRVPSISLPEAIRTVTLNPARATGLHDRGALATGLRADLARVHLAPGGPVVRQVWREGRLIA